MAATTTGSVTSKSESESINFGLFSSLLSPNKSTTLTESQDVELIARAASQATIAARSIILSGGTQATALSTAKAAALSIIYPKGQYGVGPGSGFLGRRKAKREAHVIAAMALGQVNSALQIRGSDSHLLGTSNNSNRFLQTADTQSYFGSVADSFFQDSRNSVRSENLMSNSIFFANKKDTNASVPQVPNTSGTSTITSKPSKEGIQSDSTAEVKNSTANEMQPTVASIFTTLASLSDLGSHANSTSSNKNLNNNNQESPSLQTPATRGLSNVMKKKPVEVANNQTVVKPPITSSKSPSSAPKKAPLPASRMRSLISKLPSAEDPIYHVKTKDEAKKQPFSVSKRMQQFLDSSSFDTNDDQISDAYHDSYGDSYSAGSSTYGSQESALQGTAEDDTGTEESEESSYLKGKNMGITVASDDKDFFASNATSSMFSSFSEKFLCSPVSMPRESNGIATKHDSRDDGERLRDSTLLALVGLREQEESVCTDESSMYDDDTFTCDDADTYDDTVDDSMEEIDDKKKSSSIQDSMEQLVLRALSATPGGSNLSPAPSKSGSESKTKDNEAEESTNNLKPFPLNQVTSSFSLSKSRSHMNKKMMLPWLGKKSARTSTAANDKKLTDSVSK
jgi:hypothetical protein